MLNINLIPLERRRKEKTPLPRFFIIIGVIVLCCGLSVWDVKTWLDTSKLKSDLQGKKADLKERQDAIQDLTQLMVKDADITLWLVQAQMTAYRSFKWWHGTDILLDIFNEHPNIWITSFNASGSGKKVTGKPALEASMRFDCLALGSDTTPMTDFRRGLKNSIDLTNIFNAGINEELSYNLMKLKDGWAVSFVIELYRDKIELKK